jgi:hypothetical protein
MSRARGSTSTLRVQNTTSPKAARWWHEHALRPVWKRRGRATRLLYVIAFLLACTLLVGVTIALVLAAGGTRQRSVGAQTAIAPPKLLPPIAVSVTIRKALMGEGYVLTFKNDGEQHYKFDVTHQRETLNQATTFALRLDPGASKEIGWQEGHVFYPGDTVTVSHDGNEPRKWVVNPK